MEDRIDRIHRKLRISLCMISFFLRFFVFILEKQNKTNVGTKNCGSNRCMIGDKEKDEKIKTSFLFSRFYTVNIN